MTFIRDFLRKRRLAAHVRKHGWNFAYQGQVFSLPPDVHVGVANALMRGSYERDEIQLINDFLPKDQPVLELGGSFGITGGIIGGLLNDDQRHLIVEANPALVQTCAKNAARGSNQQTDVVNCAVSYDGPTALLKMGVSPHSSHLAQAKSGGDLIEVPALSLSALHQKLGAPDGYSLISDIEGGEVDIFIHDSPIIAMAGLVIMELHPEVAAPNSPDIPQMMHSMGFHKRAQIADVWAWTR